MEGAYCDRETVLRVSHMGEPIVIGKQYKESGTLWREPTGIGKQYKELVT